MAGRRRDDSSVINSTNVFAALGTIKKKKSSDKESSSKSKGSKEPQKVFWAPAPLTVKSWADVDDEDDDDYYATTAPPPSVWGAVGDRKAKDSGPVIVESESEEDGFDELNDDVEEEHENEPEVSVEPGPVLKKPLEASLPHSDRQLSKKELKKKGLEELDAVLAEFGYNKTDNNLQDDSYGASQSNNKSLNGEVEKKDNAPVGSKTAKKKKKKDKTLKETKQSQEQPDATVVVNAPEGTSGTLKAEESSTLDVKGLLKKVATSKKKKSSKEIDAAARAAASEAAARNARVSAAKKKEKNHYNQQPVR